MLALTLIDVVCFLIAAAIAVIAAFIYNAIYYYGEHP